MPATIDDPLRGIRSLLEPFEVDAVPLVHRAIERGWGGGRNVRIALGDLALCDRATLQAIHQLRQHRHPRLAIAARIHRDLFVALRRGPLAPEGLWDSEATFQRFLADFLRAEEAAATSLALDIALPPLRRRTSTRKKSDGCTSLARIDELVRCGQYDMALDELVAALDDAREDRVALYETTALVHERIGNVEAARRAHEIARDLTT